MTLPSLPDPPRCSFGSATVDGKIYVVGGHINQTHEYASDNLTDVVDVFDIDSNTWLTRLSPRPRAAQGFYLAAYGNYLYAFGGLIHHSYSSNQNPEYTYRSVPYIDRYDIASDQWETIATLPIPRSSYVAGVVDNVVYLIGGWYGDPQAGPVGGWFLDTIDTFNLETEEVATSPCRLYGKLRRAGGAVTWGEGIIIAGGITNTTDIYTMTLDSVLYFSPGSQMPWHFFSPLPYPTFAPGVGITDENEIYVFGGWQGPAQGQSPSPNFVNKVYRLNGIKGWQEQTSMAENRGFVDVVNLDTSTFGLLAGALDPAESGYQSNAFDAYSHGDQGGAARPLQRPPRS